MQYPRLQPGGESNRSFDSDSFSCRSPPDGKRAVEARCKLLYVATAPASTCRSADGRTAAVCEYSIETSTQLRQRSNSHTARSGTARLAIWILSSLYKLRYYTFENKGSEIYRENTHFCRYISLSENIYLNCRDMVPYISHIRTLYDYVRCVDCCLGNAFVRVEQHRGICLDKGLRISV
jgi:hypothetical protein